RIDRLIPALLRVELHAQECFLLLRGPAKSAHFRSCARIQTKKELLICRSRWPQAVHHLVAILPDCPRKSAALSALNCLFILRDPSCCPFTLASCENRSTLSCDFHLLLKFFSLPRLRVCLRSKKISPPERQ